MNFKILTIVVTLVLTLNPFKQIQAFETEISYSEEELAQIAHAKTTITEWMGKIKIVQNNVAPYLDVLKNCPTFTEDHIKKTWDIITEEVKTLHPLLNYGENIFPPFIEVKLLSCCLAVEAENSDEFSDIALKMLTPESRPNQNQALIIETALNQHMRALTFMLNDLNSNKINSNDSFNTLLVPSIEVIHPLIRKIISQISNFPTTEQETNFTLLKNIHFSNKLCGIIANKINPSGELNEALTNQLTHELNTFTNRSYNSQEELIFAANELLSTRTKTTETCLEMLAYLIQETENSVDENDAYRAGQTPYWGEDTNQETHDELERQLIKMTQELFAANDQLKMQQALFEPNDKPNTEIAIENIASTLEELKKKYCKDLKPQLDLLAQCSSLAEENALLAQKSLLAILSEIDDALSIILGTAIANQKVHLNMINYILAAYTESLRQTSEKIRTLSSPISPKLFAELFDIASKAFLDGIHLFLERYHSNTLENDINSHDLFFLTINQMNDIFDFSSQIIQANSVIPDAQAMKNNARNHIQILRNLVKIITTNSDLQESFFDEIDKTQNAFFKKSFSSDEEFRIGLHTLFDDTVTIAENWLGIALSLEQ